MVSRNVIPLMVAPPAVVVRHAAEADLLVWWPTIRHWLASIRRRQGPRASWLPEHVRAAVVDRRAELWLAWRGERLVGMTVTQMIANPFSQVVDGMFVWMAYAEPTVREAVQEMETFLSGVAMDRGCTYLEALTSRPGLGRRMQRHGWECVLWVLRKDLYPLE